MKLKTQKNWTIAAIIGMAFWFFGNLYEAIVFGPNWAIEDPALLENLNAFFVKSSPTFYFMPTTLIAVIIIVVLTFLNKEASVKREYRIAAILAVAIAIFTSYIVASVLSQMFGPGFYKNPTAGSSYGQLWNMLNAIRLVMEVVTITYLFNAFRKLDKL